MQAPQRMAMGERLQQLLANGVFQDAGEIALVTGLLTAGQLAAGGDPEAVALAAALGAGASIPARPVAAAMGRGVGRFVDAQGIRPAANSAADRAYRHLVTQNVPGTNANTKMLLANGLLGTPYGQASYNRYMNSGFNADGSRRGFVEHDLGVVARQYGDNAAQAAVQLMAPGLIAAAEPPASEEGGKQSG